MPEESSTERVGIPLDTEEVDSHTMTGTRHQAHNQTTGSNAQLSHAALGF